MEAKNIGENFGNQVKIFSQPNNEQLESEINNWLSENDVKIIKLTYNTSVYVENIAKHNHNNDGSVGTYTYNRENCLILFKKNRSLPKEGLLEFIRATENA